MPLVIDNGQEIHVDVEFVSNSIHDAYISDKPWDIEGYVWVELESIFIWITKSEQEELSRLTETDEIDKYVRKLNVLAIRKEDFDNWRQRER